MLPQWRHSIGRRHALCVVRRRHRAPGAGRGTAFGEPRRARAVRRGRPITEGMLGLPSLRSLLWGLRACFVVALLVLSGSARGIAANSVRDRTISFYNIHSKETLTVQYMKDGKHVAAAMDQINWVLRD